MPAMLSFNLIISLPTSLTLFRCVYQYTEMPVYLNLYTPALDWILQCAAYRATDDVMTEILGVFSRSGNSALLLNSIISSFSPEYIAARCKRRWNHQLIYIYIEMYVYVDIYGDGMNMYMCVCVCAYLRQ